MIPTVEWMSKYFDTFNKKYFGGKLNTPSFVVGCQSGNWGYFHYDAEYNRLTRTITKVNSIPKLMLTNKYDRRAKDVANTMLHEMIHLYIYSVLKKYPIMQHGQTFQKIANKLNADGWEISEENELKPTDKLVTTKNNSKQNSNTVNNPNPNISKLIITLDNMISTNQFKKPNTIKAANNFKVELGNEQIFSEAINKAVSKAIKNTINEIKKAEK